MSQDAREYALGHGAPVMLYPTTETPFEQRFMDCPELTASQIVNMRRIDGLKYIFGAWRWPSNG